MAPIRLGQEHTGWTPAVSRRAVLGPMAASMAFVMELTTVPLLLPTIQLQLGLSIRELTWVFNSYGVAVAIGVLVGGWLGDAFSARRVFSAGAACFAIGSSTVSLAGSFEMLIIGRMLQGFGGGVFSPLVPLLLTRASPEQPGRMLIVWGSVTGYIAAFAPLFYSSFLESYGWNLAFQFTALLAIIAIIITFPYGARRQDRNASFSAPKMNYGQVLRSRDLWVMFVYVFCTYGAITHYLFSLPTKLANQDIDAASIGFTLSIMWLSFSALSTLLRNRMDAAEIQAIILSAPLLIGVGLPLLFLFESPFWFLISAILVGSGLACSNAPSTHLILRFAPKGMSAISASLDITFARLGGVATVAFLTQPSLHYTLPVILILCVIAAICGLVAMSDVAQNSQDSCGSS